MFLRQKIPADRNIELTENQEKIQSAMEDAAKIGDMPALHKALKSGGNPRREDCLAFWPCL